VSQLSFQNENFTNNDAQPDMPIYQARKYLKELPKHNMDAFRGLLD